MSDIVEANPAELGREDLSGQPPVPSNRRAAMGVGLFNAHGSWLVALIPFAVVLFRAQRVARFNTTTALGLLSAAGPFNVTLGVLIPFVGVAVCSAFVVLCLGALKATTGMARVMIGAGLTFGVLASILFGPLYVVLPWLAFVAFASLVAATLRGRPRPGVAGTVLVCLLAALLLAAFVSDIPWMPAERVTFAGATAASGYVVSIADGWVTFLSDEDRTVSLHPEGDLDARHVCETDDPWDDSLMGLLWDEPGVAHYPPCD